MLIQAATGENHTIPEPLTVRNCSAHHKCDQDSAINNRGGSGGGN